MKKTVWILFLFITLASSGQKGKPGWFVGGGLDYRMYPIDVEDVPRGPLPRDNSLPGSDTKFWRPVSLHTRFGWQTAGSWLFSLSAYGRYNQFHRIEGINYANLYPQNLRTKKNFKSDIFLDIEKKIGAGKKTGKNFFVLAGLGLTNINSRWDVVLTDTSASGSPFTVHYKGTFLHFGPRLSLGYQHKGFKISLDGYMIEDRKRANLTALWCGATVSYEIALKKKK